jgi:hypothetical protein
MRISRRTVLQTLGLATAGAALSRAPRGARAEPPPPRKFLLVLAATGGASILDGALAIRASESKNASTLNTFPDQLVNLPDGSPFRSVDQRIESVGAIPVALQTDQTTFVRKHCPQMLVVTGTGTSVNHAIGQRRSVTGNEAWNGRTLQEIVALSYGQGLPIPNVHLATGTAFTERGTDVSLPTWAYGEPVADPALWLLSLDGAKGLSAPPSREQLDPRSSFARVFGRSPRGAQWEAQRGDRQRAIEAADLVTKLMLFSDSEQHPLAAHGLSSSPAAARVRDVFPRYEIDPLEAQAALAFLLFKFGVAVTVTIGPSYNLVFDVEDTSAPGLADGSLKNTPIAFDFSHQAHRQTQGLMWHRLYGIADRLIGLLEEEEYGGGASLWDNTLLYMPTEFGRSRQRPADADQFGSGHDLNNASLLVSPLFKGNRILGGLDPDTGLTHGYDPRTGVADPTREMPENVLFAGILDVLGVDTAGSGLPQVTAFRGEARLSARCRGLRRTSLGLGSDVRARRRRRPRHRSSDHPHRFVEVPPMVRRARRVVRRPRGDTQEQASRTYRVEPHLRGIELGRLDVVGQQRQIRRVRALDERRPEPVLGIDQLLGVGRGLHELEVARELCGEHPGEAVGGRALACRGEPRRREELVADSLDDRAEDRLLVGEIRINGRFRDLGLGREELDARSFEPVEAEEPGRCFDDASPLLLRGGCHGVGIARLDRVN